MPFLRHPMEKAFAFPPRCFRCFYRARGFRRLLPKQAWPSDLAHYWSKKPTKPGCGSVQDSHRDRDILASSDRNSSQWFDRLCSALMPTTSAVPAVLTASPPAQPTPTVEVKLGGAEIVEELGEEWRALCAESSDDQPFYRPEWVGAYVRAYVPPGRLLLFEARAGGKLTGVLPMVHERVLFSAMPVEKFRGPSVLSGWRFDLVRRAGPEGDAAVIALWRFVKDFPGWDVLEFPDVRDGGAAEGFAGAAEANGFPTGRVECMHTPYIPLSGWDGER
jgi:hypothetical protein